MQDLIAVSIPYMIYFSLPFVVASLIYDPSMRLLIHAALPECCKKRLTFWICFVEEIRFLLMYIAIAVPAWQLQVMAFDLVNSSLDVLVDNATKT